MSGWGSGMSMICWVQVLSPDHIAALRRTPSLASDLARVAQDDQQRGRLAVAISRMPVDKRAAAEALYRASEERNAEARTRLERIGPFEPPLDLEKSWHMLHYLFTGHIDASRAPGDALLSGKPLGDDVGYGPPRLHDENETRNFAEFLERVDAATLQERVNYREMSRAGVYSMPMGQGSDADYEGELRTEVAAYFPRLRDYVVKAAEGKDGLLIWLS